MDAPITTTGGGARGFNVYDGTIRSASSRSITTHGDGSIGIQVSRPTGPIAIDEHVSTTGGEGTSLVEGVQMTLKAIPVSIKPGGVVPALTVGGRIECRGDDVTAFEVLEDAELGELAVGGGIHALGAHSVATKIEGTAPSLDGIEVSAQA